MNEEREVVTRPEVIRELRSMFKEGATPSRLIRHIAERHEDENRLHFLAQEYFLEAFSVPIVRGLKPLDRHDHTDLRYWFLNEHLVHEIIQHRGEWDNDVTDGEGGWLESLKATDIEDCVSQVRGSQVRELAQSWNQLTPQEQNYIQRSLGSANELFEKVQILSRLVECLQQKIVALEQECAPAAEAHT